MFTAELQTLTEGLFYISESDAPFEIVDTSNPKAVQSVLDNIIADELEEETRTLDDFFRNAIREEEGMDEFALAQVKKNQALKDYIQGKCGENVHIFRLGEKPEIDIYIVGKTPENQYIILKTKAIET